VGAGALVGARGAGAVEHALTIRGTAATISPLVGFLSPDMLCLTSRTSPSPPHPLLILTLSPCSLTWWFSHFSFSSRSFCYTTGSGPFGCATHSAYASSYTTRGSSAIRRT
jgi:hypothetical protein